MKLYKTPLLFASIFSLASKTAFADLSPLISPAQLQDRLGEDDLVVLDIRSRNVENSDLSIFLSGHIPGSINAPYGLFRGPAENPGQLIEEQDLEALLQSLGLELSDKVIVTYQGKSETDFGSAARVYWTLKSSGFEQLAILNGGINAWLDEGLRLDDGAADLPEASDIDITFSSEWLATTTDIEAILANNSDGFDLIDARPVEFWEGEKKHPAALKPGTLPQSRYFEHYRWFSPANTALVDVSAVEGLISDGGFSNDDALVSFCNTGHWAATNWFALSELGGLQDVRLYPGSMVEYSSSGGKLANTPGLLGNLINRITGG